MKKLILLLLGISIISCGGSSEDDDMNGNNNSETFLEKYDGNAYSYVDPEDSDWILHFFFYDSLYFWGYVDDEIDPNASDEYQFCSKFKTGNNPYGDGDNVVLSIISEEEDEMIVEFEEQYDGETIVVIYTFRIQGDNLNVTINDGELTNFTMTRVTDTTYDDLCN